MVPIAEGRTKWCDPLSVGLAVGLAVGYALFAYDLLRLHPLTLI